MGFDPKHTIGADAFSERIAKRPLLIDTEARRVFNIKEELDTAGNLVNVLPTRAPASGEEICYLGMRYTNAGKYFQRSGHGTI